MSIPDFQTAMLPLLQFAGDSKEHSLREAIVTLADEFGLSAEERQELLPSGQQATFDNRVGWACTHLKKAMLLKSTKRAHFAITARGIEILANPPDRIDISFLNQFPEFVEFRTRRQTTADKTSSQNENDDKTPEESMEEAFTRIRQDLASELLDTVKGCSPAFFERLVVDLLVKMGYGGTRRDAGKAIGMSGDEGIDGIINEDRLGLDVVYIQAKRWETSVSRPEIQKFAGALQGQRAKKGVFITTSCFTSAARDYVSRIDNKIVLIDGETLANLMMDFDVGVSSIARYELKRVDMDYFAGE